MFQVHIRGAEASVLGSPRLKPTLDQTVAAGLPAMALGQAPPDIPPSRASPFPGSALLEQRFGALADLCFVQILLAGGQEPHMTERISQRGGAVAVELVLGFGNG